MSIIIKTPQPDTEERLVLVPPESVSRSVEGVSQPGACDLAVHTNNARDATPDDLARGGYVRDGDTRAGLREALRARERAELDALAELDEQRARAEKAEGLLIQRETELRLAREDGAAVERQMREARSAADASFVRANRAEMRAEKAERERDEALGRAQSETEWRVRAVSERQDAEAERATLRAELAEARKDREDWAAEAKDLRAELARLTLVDEEEPTVSWFYDTYCARPESTQQEDCADAYRLGVAHERARQQPRDRATDEARPLREVSAEMEAMRTTHDERERVYVGAIASDKELVTVYRRAAEPLGDEHGVSLRDLVRRCQARGVLAVAARVRQERCLVAQAVARGWYIYVCPRKDDDSKWDIEAGRVIAGRSDGGAMLHAVPAADVSATLARLLGEVSR